MDGLSKTGFIPTHAATLLASACSAWARPISPPSKVAAELSDIFCALNGTTRYPSSAKMRPKPAVIIDLPTCEAVPRTIKAFLRSVGFPAVRSGLTARPGAVLPFDPIAIFHQIPLGGHVRSSTVDLEAPSAVVNEIGFNSVDRLDEMIHAVSGIRCDWQSLQQYIEYGTLLLHGDHDFEG